MMPGQHSVCTSYKELLCISSFLLYYLCREPMRKEVVVVTLLSEPGERGDLVALLSGMAGVLVSQGCNGHCAQSGSCHLCSTLC